MIKLGKTKYFGILLLVLIIACSLKSVNAQHTQYVGVEINQKFCMTYYSNDTSNPSIGDAEYTVLNNVPNENNEILVSWSSNSGTQDVFLGLDILGEVVIFMDWDYWENSEDPKIAGGINLNEFDVIINKTVKYFSYHLLKQNPFQSIVYKYDVNNGILLLISNLKQNLDPSAPPDELLLSTITKIDCKEANIGNSSNSFTSLNVWSLIILILGTQIVSRSGKTRI